MTFFRQVARQHNAATGEPTAAESVADLAAEAITLAEAVVAFCRDQHLPAEPKVYEVLFTHLGGTSPALSARIAAEQDRHVLTHAFLIDLHEDMTNGETARSLGLIQQGLGREVDAIAETVATSIEAGRRSNETVQRLNEHLAGAQTRQQLRTLGNHMLEVGLDQIGATNRMREALRNARHRLSVLERELARHAEQANTDHLTGLPNRRSIDESLARLFRDPANPATADGLVMLDIDLFKSINDTYGHTVGDNILRKFAEVLRDCAGTEAIAARWGGEEFAVLVKGGGRPRVAAVAERIRATIEGLAWRSRLSGVHIGIVTASGGCALRRPDDTVCDLLERADAALYRAKAGGRNRIYLEEELVVAGSVVTGSAEAPAQPSPAPATLTPPNRPR